MAATTLDVVGLGMQFEGLAALADVDMGVPAGQIRGVIGPNGAGKTTLFNCLTGFYRPTSGEIRIDGARVDGLQAHEISAVGVSRTFQNIRLFSTMTAIENVLIGRHRHTRTGGTEVVRPIRPSGNRLLDIARQIPQVPAAAVAGVVELAGAITRPPAVRRADEDAAARAHALLATVGLAGRDNVIARNLPYGDQRRLEIARALATEPGLLLLDEPTAGMNPQESLSMVGLIRRVRDELGTTIVLIEHQMRVVMGVCEYITVLDYGRKIAEGTPLEVQRDSRVIEAYLGTRAISGGGHGAT